MSTGFETYGSELGPESIVLTALNKGHQSVTLTGAGINLPDGQHVAHLGTSGNANFPHELRGGNNCFIIMHSNVVAEQLRRSGFSGILQVTGYFRDALEKKYETKDFSFDVDKNYE